MAVEPRNFLLNTDYEMDKIIYFTSGSINPGETKFISHNLGFAPLVFGVCAFNEDFSDSRISPYQQWLDSGYIQFQFWSTNEHIRLGYHNDQSGSQKLYYRIYAFEPSNSSAQIAPTSDKAKKFVLNTDYNYCKLFKKGIAHGNATIQHNLGYIPFVLAWSGDPYTMPAWYSDPDLDNIAVTTSSIVIKSTGDTHYRIYYDEA